MIHVDAGSENMNKIVDRGLGQQLISSVLTTGAVRHADREALYCSGTGRRLTFPEIQFPRNRFGHAFTARRTPKERPVRFSWSRRPEDIVPCVAVPRQH